MKVRPCRFTYLWMIASYSTGPDTGIVEGSEDGLFDEGEIEGSTGLTEGTEDGLCVGITTIR